MLLKLVFISCLILKLGSPALNPCPSRSEDYVYVLSSQTDLSSAVWLVGQPEFCVIINHLDNELVTLNINMHNIYYMCNLYLVDKIQPMKIALVLLLAICFYQFILLALVLGGYIVNCLRNT